MSTRNPHIVVIAGPNGAGKSTAATRLLRGPLEVQEFVDADVIARELRPSAPDSVAIEAGRVMLERLGALAVERVSFAFETTLASRSFAVARVRDRVDRGGHNVPDATVRRRYQRGLKNFFHIYRGVATSWRFYNNSSRIGPKLIAKGGVALAQRVRDRTLWVSIERAVTND